MEEETARASTSPTLEENLYRDSGYASLNGIDVKPLRRLVGRRVSETRHDGRWAIGTAGGRQRPRGLRDQRRRASPADREDAEGSRPPPDRRGDRRNPAAGPRRDAVPGPGGGGPLAKGVRAPRRVPRTAVPPAPPPKYATDHKIPRRPGAALPAREVTPRRGAVAPVDTRPFADHDLSRRNTLGPSSHDPPDLPDARRRRRDRLRPDAPGAVNSAVGLRGAVLHRPADIAEVVVSAGDPGPMTATEAPARGDRSGPLGLQTTADRKDRLLEGGSSGLVLADPSTGPLGGRAGRGGHHPRHRPEQVPRRLRRRLPRRRTGPPHVFSGQPVRSLRARWLAPLRPPTSGFSPALPLLHHRMVVPFFEFFDSPGRKWRMVE